MFNVVLSGRINQAMIDDSAIKKIRKCTKGNKLEGAYVECLQEKIMVD